jgi:hypothetical protein
MVTQPKVFLGGSEILFTAYVLLPSPGTIASRKLPLLLDLTVTSLTRQYFVFSTALANIIGILALHVDDTIGGGTPALFDAMRLIGSVLKIGAEESAKDGSFLYAGLRISTCPTHHTWPA